MSDAVVSAPEPANERSRLRRLRMLAVLDSGPEPEFDRVARLAAEVLGVPIALVTLLDAERQWFKARVGLDVGETPRRDAFCAWTVASGQLLEVRDARADPRFADNPLVTGPPFIRFYAGAPLRSPDGALGTLCVIDRQPRQLTERDRRLLQELAEIVSGALLSRLELMVSRRRAHLLELSEQLSGVGHWRIDLVLNEVLWSKQVFRIHGVDPGSYQPSVAKGVEAYHPADRDKVQRHIDEAIATREPFDFKLRLMRTDGALRVVRAVGEPDVDPSSDEVVALFGVFVDVTDEHQRLVRAERMASMGNLAAGVAHEINNPLSYILGNAQSAKEELERHASSLPKVVREDLGAVLDEIVDGSRRIRRISRDLKRFARGAETTEIISLGEVARTAVRLCANELRHRARVEVDVAEEVKVSGDEVQLVEVLTNLLVNAGHAVQGRVEDNLIAVRVGEREGAAFLEVQDSGQGMSAEVKARAFSPFFTTKADVGTGLGLAICQRIVSSHGGRIELDSEPGHGTRFRVSLPPAALDTAGDGGEPAGATPMSARPVVRGRILLVDDDAAVARSMKRLLKGRGHEVEAVFDAEMALERLSNGARYDAILCDIMMPRMSGPKLYQAVARLDAAYAERIVFVSGGVFTEEATSFMKQCNAPVLEKPVDAAELFAAVDERVAASRGAAAPVALSPPATGRPDSTASSV